MSQKMKDSIFHKFDQQQGQFRLSWSYRVVIFIATVSQVSNLAHGPLVYIYFPLLYYGSISKQTCRAYVTPLNRNYGHPALLYLQARFSRVKKEESLYSPRPSSPASSYDSTTEFKSESEAEGKRVVMKQEREYSVRIPIISLKHD